MDEKSDNSGTKLPEIRNVAKQEPVSEHGTRNGILQGDVQTNGMNTGRGNSLQNMSRHSSRKSVPMRSIKENRTLKDAKKERKQVEKDAELLANRIALLKQEEMRTWKKIEETRKRAKEVLDMKKKNEERIKKKMRDIKDKSRRMRLNQKRVKLLRETRQQEKGKIKQAVLTYKRQEFRMTKIEGKKNLRIKSEMMRRHLESKKQQSKAIKEQLRIAELKKREYEREKLERAKKEFEDKIDRELRLTRQKEKEVMQMEMIEMELIKKLQNTQNIQKNAYKELENALAQPSVFFQQQKLMESERSVDK
jgi:hypothetical protein